MELQAKYNVGDKVTVKTIKVKGKIKEVDPVISMYGMLYRYFVTIPKAKADWYWESELTCNV